MDITFEAEKNKPDWSTRISKNLKKNLHIHFLSVGPSKFKGILFFPKNQQDEIDKTLSELKNTNEIISYDIRPPVHDTIPVKIIASKAPVCTTVQKNDFQIISPITVKSNSKIYRIRGLIESNTHKSFDKITKTLTDDGILVQNVSKVIMFDSDSESVLECLHKTKNKREISKKTNIPIKKVELILKMLNDRGIINMIDLQKNTKKLRLEIRAVISEEKKLLN